MFRLMDRLGNGVKLGDDLVLTAQHIMDDERIAFAVDDCISQPRLVRTGGRGVQGADWTLALVETPASVPSCPFEPTQRVFPGQDVLVLGYWSQDGEARFPVAVTGTIIETPSVFRPGWEAFGCMNLGRPIVWNGLSGSPVLVKDPGSSVWRLAGVYAGHASTHRDDYVQVFSRLPRNFSDLIDQADLMRRSSREPR